MKTTIANIRRNLLLSAFAAMILLISNQAVALSKDPDTSAKEVTVQYLGTMYGQPLFQLNVPNDAADNITISLENENGEELYTQKSNEKFFTKKIRLATTETNIVLKLRVYSHKTKETQVYQINKTTKQSDNIVINQVK